MDEDVKKFAVKFIESTGRWADIELFNEDDAWEFMKDLLNDYARSKSNLSDGQAIVLRNLGAALGVKPGSPIGSYFGALTRAFGPSPMDEAELKEVAMWVHTQLNGGGGFEPARKPPVALQAGPVGSRPGRPPRRR